MRKLFFFYFAFILSISLNSQTSFKKSDKVIGLGMDVGIKSKLGGNISMPNYLFTPSFDICVADNLLKGKSSIGLGLCYVGDVISIGDHSKDKGMDMFALRSTFHYQFINRLDTYVGLYVGFFQEGDAGGGILGTYLGTRYYFTDWFGVSVELRGDYILDISTQAGIVFKF